MTLLQTDFLPAKSETFQSFRWLLQRMGILQSGVGNPLTEFLVVQHAAGANMSVDVGAGHAWVIATTAIRQGIYHQENDNTVTLTVQPSDGTNPRIDQVVLTINDSSLAGISDTPQLQVLAGVPTAGATLANKNGAAALPNNSTIRLAYLLIPAGSTSVITANIQDARTAARAPLSFYGGVNVQLLNFFYSNLDTVPGIAIGADKIQFGPGGTTVLDQQINRQVVSSTACLGVNNHFVTNGRLGVFNDSTPCFWTNTQTLGIHGFGGDTMSATQGPTSSGYDWIRGTGFDTMSDIRLKEDVEALNPDDVLERLLKIPVYTHATLGGVDPEFIEATPEHVRRARTHDVGVMAHEVAEQFPELVAHTAKDHVPEAVDYGRLAALAISGLQSLTKRVEALEAKLS